MNNDPSHIFKICFWVKNFYKIVRLFLGATSINGLRIHLVTLFKYPQRKGRTGIFIKPNYVYTLIYNNSLAIERLTFTMIRRDGVWAIKVTRKSP